MNSLITDGSYAWCSGPWFAERNEAVQHGFTKIFVKELDGRHRSLSNPQKFYADIDLNISKRKLTGMRLTLVLIEPKNGDDKGTMIEYTF